MGPPRMMKKVLSFGLSRKLPYSSPHFLKSSSEAFLPRLQSPILFKLHSHFHIILSIYTKATHENPVPTLSSLPPTLIFRRKNPQLSRFSTDPAPFSGSNPNTPASKLERSKGTFVQRSLLFLRSSSRNVISKLCFNGFSLFSIGLFKKKRLSNPHWDPLSSLQRENLWTKIDIILV